MEQLELNEISSKEIKNVNTTFGGYTLLLLLQLKMAKSSI